MMEEDKNKKVLEVVSEFRAYIGANDMLSLNESVLVAVSGGVDSVVLLSLLLAIKDDFALKLSVCHLDHGLRGDQSKADMEFVRELSEKLGLPFFGKALGEGELTGGGSTQERARGARYDFFEDAMKEAGASKVALAHNLDDQAETVLMRLLSGGGLKGLGGIPPKRGHYIRPLLGVKRSSIEAHAKALKIKHVTDSTNASEKYTRNRVRLSLMPLLEEGYNPALKEHLALLAERARIDISFIEAEAAKLYSEALIVDKDCKCSDIVFDREKLLNAERALTIRCFFMATDELSSVDHYSSHAEEFLELINSAAPNRTLELPRGLFARREYERVVIGRGMSEEDALSFLVELNIPGITAIPEIGASLKAEILDEESSAACKRKLKDNGAVYFDMDRLGEPLEVRGFLPGDRLRPFGMEGHTKLKDIFIDNKIPANERPSVPLVVSSGEIIWAAGVKRSEGARVLDETRKVLRLELIG